MNGIEVGEVVFDGRTAAVTSFPVAQSVLGSGNNTVSFETRGGVDDMTLVTYVRVTYQRAYVADANQLTLEADGGQELTISGFTSDSIHVVDITGDVATQRLQGTVDRRRGNLVDALDGAGRQPAEAVHRDRRRPWHAGLGNGRISRPR